MLDSQYQYDSGGDYLFSLLGSYSRETRDWNASFPLGGASNASDNLNTFKLDAHYWYQSKIGGGFGIFDYSGNTDQSMYGTMAMASAMGNTSGSPDTRGWIAEANWLPLENRQNLKLGLRYTAYTKFNGTSTNYNGAGRDASNNNSIFMFASTIF